MRAPARATEPPLFARPATAALATFSLVAAFLTPAGALQPTLDALPVPVAVAAPEPHDGPARHEVRSDRARRTAVTQVPVSKSKAVRHVSPAKAHTKTTTPRPRAHKQRRPKRHAAQLPTLSVAASGRAAIVVRWALAQVGKRYVWGTAGPGTFDCSGLVMAAYARVGIRLPHQSGGIAGRGRAVPMSQIQPGDVITYAGHVSLYVGRGLMVEAANPRAGIRVTRVRPGSVRRLL